MRKFFLLMVAIILLYSSVATALTIREGVWLKGTVQTELRWQKYRNPTASENDSTGDIYLRRIELGLSTAIPSWLRTSLVLNSEWLADDLHNNDTSLQVYEAAVRLQKTNVPGYLIVGKRMFDFGMFENHLLTYPLTRDLYETRTVGFTLGYEKASYDMSFTIYDSEEMITHMVHSGLIGGLSRTVSNEYSDDIGSYIVTLKAYSNKKQNVLYISYLSEPGPERNETIATGLGLSYSQLRIFGEYFKALKRERFQGLNDEYKESAYSVSIAYGTVSPRTKAPQRIVIRFEHLDDDGLAKALGTWSVKDRYSVGIISGLMSDRATGISAYVGIEYRYTKFRTFQVMEDSNQEVYLRVAVDF